MWQVRGLLLLYTYRREKRWGRDQGIACMHRSPLYFPGQDYCGMEYTHY